MNRLAQETSPYLLQHRDNPVDWHPWGDEAFAQAQAEDKPILLSIGYSACHWCHVMAHESFEHEPTAQIMNDLFVNIKVDREERPDVDDIYMQAVLAMNRGQGGWPLTVFLTPDGKPFYGGTYYPREARFGIPSFRQVMEAVHDAYANRRDQLNAQADQLAQALQRDFLDIVGEDEQLNTLLLEQAASALMQQVDRVNGGFGSQPKFPNPMNLAYLLRYHHHSQSQEALSVVELSLKKMAMGGIYDQIGGGFARYSVDAFWLVPHFEKMLYDNAQLSRLYLQAYQVTGDAFYREIAEEIYDYILREMTAPEGGFYSATDADSEGEEGKFFVWTLDELRQALAPIADDVPRAEEIAIAYYGATAGGNFEGKNILYRPHDDEDIAQQLEISVDELRSAIQQIKDRLYAVRTSRVYPGLDDKILSAWNGMMLASLAEAARVLERDDYRVAAERAGDFICEHLIYDDGRVYRTYKNGIAKLNGYLEDYANLIDAMLELYQLTYLDQWYEKAVALADAVLAHFSADEGGFYDTSDDHESLIVRPRNLQDNASPAGNTMMAKQLLRLSAYSGDARYETSARGMLRLVISAMRQYPQAFGEALNATDLLVRGISEVALVGKPTQPDMQAMLKALRESYRPNIITALAREDVPAEHKIPLLSYRSAKDNAPTAYICRNFACRMPVTNHEDMVALLGENI
jgi:uncharacterized protein YyaL (SSP411 family)